MRDLSSLWNIDRLMSNHLFNIYNDPHYPFGDNNKENKLDGESEKTGKRIDLIYDICEVEIGGLNEK